MSSRDYIDEGSGTGLGIAVVLGLGVVGGIIYLATRPRSSGGFGSPRESSAPSANASPNAMGYSVATWIPQFAAPAAAAGIPLSYITRSMQEESGGNPCSIGAPGDLGPDGNPRELGIYQVYNPDDLKKVGVTGSQLRAYCVAGMSPVNYKGRTVMSHSQSVARPLTPQEMQQQVDVAIGKIKESRDTADAAATAAGVTWPRTPDAAGHDFWCLVKLVHGLPGLVHGIIKVTAHLGHPPASWSEYRHEIESGAVVLDPKTEGYRSQFGSLFNNAEKAASGLA
jgi:hypothetical protein